MEHITNQVINYAQQLISVDNTFMRHPNNKIMAANELTSAALRRGRYEREVGLLLAKLDNNYCDRTQVILLWMPCKP